MNIIIQSHLKHLVLGIILFVISGTLSTTAQNFPPCTASGGTPNGLIADQITLGSARLHYYYSGSAPYATFYWKITGTTNWNTNGGYSLNNYTIYNLQPSTAYEWKIVRCCTSSGGPCSPGSSISHFTTLSCSTVNIDTSVTVNGNTLTANDSVAKYQWFDCSAISFAGNDTNQSFSPGHTGSYAVSITKGQCSDTSSCISVTITGIHENNSSNHFSIYSFNKIIQIKLNDAHSMIGFITVYNTFGQEIRKIKIENRDMQIDLSNCSSEIYFVIIQTNDTFEMSKFYLH